MQQEDIGMTLATPQTARLAEVIRLASTEDYREALARHTLLDAGYLEGDDCRCLGLITSWRAQDENAVTEECFLFEFSRPLVVFADGRIRTFDSDSGAYFP